MLSIVVHLHSLRWVIPACIMMGASPCVITVWSFLRFFTALMPNRVYRNGDDILYSLYQRMVLFFFHTCTGLEIVGYGDCDAILNKKENAIYLSNHQCTVDWIVANMCAINQGSIGHIRYIMKDGLRFLPLYGFYFKQHNGIYVRKSGKFNQQKTEHAVEQIKKNIPVWLVIFPEGTRFNPELPVVIQKSKAFAREHGLVELQNVLTPRQRALQLCVKQLSDYVDAVYDITIAYSNTQDAESGERLTAYGMPDFLLGKSPQIHLHMERIDMYDVPIEEEKLKHWLHDQFVKKDNLLAHFYSNDPKERGRFPGTSQIIKIGRRQTIPGLLMWGTCLFAALATTQGRSLYWKVAVFGTVGGCLWMAIRS